MEGDTVRLKSWYTDDDLRGIGAKLEGMNEITVQDGKITSDTWTTADESMAALQAAAAGLPETGGAALFIYLGWAGLLAPGP